MFKLLLCTLMTLNACSTAAPPKLEGQLPGFYGTFVIKFVDGAATCQEIIHAIDGIPAQVEMQNDFDGNIFHSDTQSLVITFRGANPEQIRQLKTKLAQLGPLQIIEKQTN